MHREMFTDAETAPDSTPSTLAAVIATSYYMAAAHSASSLNTRNPLQRRLALLQRCGRS